MTVQGDRGLDVRMLWFWNRPDREEPVMLARDLLDSGRVDEALTVTEVAMAREPGDVDVLLVRACALVARGDLPRAQRLLVRAAAMEPGWAEPWVRLAEILRRRGDEERAIAVLERARAIDPEHPEADRLLRSMKSRRDLDARLARFRRDPLREEPCMLTRALLDAGRLDEAQSVIDRALADDPDDVDALALAARALFARGRPESARSALERALCIAHEWQEARVLYEELFGEPPPRPDTAADIEADLARLAPPEPTLEDVLDELAREIQAITSARRDTLVGSTAPIAPNAWGLYRPPSPTDLFPRTEA